jgi:hypothetical protein
MKKIIIIALLLQSCNLEKQAMKHLHKAEIKSPLKVAEYCAKNFPVIITATDTIVEIEYDSIIVDCPPTKTDWILQKDSTGNYSKQGVIAYKKSNNRGLIRTDTTSRKKVLHTKTIFNTITKYVKDSAAVQQYKLLYDNCVQSSTISNDKLENKNQWIKWLLVALSVSAILNILFITNRK